MEKKDIAFQIISQKTTKDNENNEFLEISGYGSVFGALDSYADVVEKGAFEDTLETRTPAMLWQHDGREPIGVWSVVKEDNKGLYMEGKLPLSDTLVSGRVAPQLKAGSIGGLSIGFSIVEDRYDKKAQIRYLEKIKLYEVSLVTMPALTSATIDNIKSIGVLFDMPIKELSEFFREHLNDVLSKTCCDNLAKIVKSQSRDGKEEKSNELDYTGLLDSLKSVNSQLDTMSHRII